MKPVVKGEKKSLLTNITAVTINTRPIALVKLEFSGFQLKESHKHCFVKSDWISNNFTKKKTGTLNHWGSRDGAVMRALASHQCGPGLIPGLGVICGLSLLLVLILASRFFSLGTSVFPSSSKTNISKFQFDLEFQGHRFISHTTVKCHPC